jgi:hypothetical protein
MLDASRAPTGHDLTDRPAEGFPAAREPTLCKSLTNVSKECHGALENPRSVPDSEDVLLLAAMAAVGGVGWLLANYPRPTLAVFAWGTLTWCGWILGAAFGDSIAAGVAGAILVGSTAAVKVADSIYGVLSEL